MGLTHNSNCLLTQTLDRRADGFQPLLRDIWLGSLAPSFRLGHTPSHCRNESGMNQQMVVPSVSQVKKGEKMLKKKNEDSIAEK